MKYRKILLIFAIATLSLTACKKEQNPASVENTTIEETTREETATDSKTDDNMNTITNADRGAAVGEVVANATSTETNNPYADYGKTDESLADYEVTITEELNTQMYVIKDSNILKLDQEGAGAIAPAEVGAYLTVTGKTSNGWYEVAWGNSKGYLPADILSNENPNPNPQPAPSDTVSDSGRPADEVLEDFWELMGEGWDDGSGGGISQEALDNQTVTPDFDKTPNW